MKRTHISLEQIADISNLHVATYKAALGKRNRPVVRRFIEQLDWKLNQLATDILTEHMPYGCFQTFAINDPKPRLIRAACFEDRVFHHALMNHAGPVLERAMFAHSFACRPGKGVHLAVRRVQAGTAVFTALSVFGEN